MTSLGYMRVSTEEQTLDLQKDALTAAGVLPSHVYEDCASGKRDDRPGLDGCLKALREGDTLVVWKLDRLGRSLKHLISIVNDLEHRGIGLKLLTGLQIDTSNATGKLFFHIFAAVAQFEREIILERTHAGLAAARARGNIGGRKPKMTQAQMRLAMASMGKPGCKVGDLAKELGIDRTTLYSYVYANGKPTPKGMKFMEGGK